MSLWVTTTGPGRSQVSTNWAIARNVSKWEASSSAHGCPVAAARSRSSLPHVDECTIDGVGHLLHIERPEPVAQAIATFLGRHPFTNR